MQTLFKKEKRSSSRGSSHSSSSHCHSNDPKQRKSDGKRRRRSKDKGKKESKDKVKKDSKDKLKKESKDKTRSRSKEKLSKKKESDERAKKDSKDKLKKEKEDKKDSKDKVKDKKGSEDKVKKESKHKTRSRSKEKLSRKKRRRSSGEMARQKLSKGKKVTESDKPKAEVSSSPATTKPSSKDAQNEENPLRTIPTIKQPVPQQVVQVPLALPPPVPAPMPPPMPPLVVQPLPPSKYDADLTDTTIEVKIQIKQSPPAESLDLERAASKEAVDQSSKLPGRVEASLRRSNENSGNESLPVVPFNSLNRSLVGKSKLEAELFNRLTGKLGKTGKAVTRDPLALGPEKSRSGKDCRICLQLIEDEQNSIHPCACTGSQAFVHKHCLHEWIRIRGSNKCDVCANEYSGLNLVKQHRGFIDWVTSNPLISAYLVVGFVIGFFFFYILFIGYLEFKTSEGLVMQPLRILLLIITIVYTVLFSVIAVALILKGVTSYMRWRRENYTVTLGPLPGQVLGGPAPTTVLTIDRSSKNVKQQVNDPQSRSLFADGQLNVARLAQGYKV